MQPWFLLVLCITSLDFSVLGTAKRIGVKIPLDHINTNVSIAASFDGDVTSVGHFSGRWENTTLLCVVQSQSSGRPRIYKYKVETGEKVFVAGSLVHQGGKKDGHAAEATFGQINSLDFHWRWAFWADKDYHSIRSIDFSTSIVTTIAPVGHGESGHRDGSLSIARFHMPEDTAACVPPFTYQGCKEGLYVADTMNKRIRHISIVNGGTSDGNIEFGEVNTLAGHTASSSDPKDGVGSMAYLSQPTRLALDRRTRRGLLYISCKHRIRKLDLYSQEVTTLVGFAGKAGMTDGNIDVARLTYPISMTLSRDGTQLYFSEGRESSLDVSYPRVRVVDMEKKSLRSIAGSDNTIVIDGWGWDAAFQTPRSLVLDEDAIAPTLYVGDKSNLRKIESNGGTVNTWGDVRYGGGPNNETARASSVVQIEASTEAIAALTKDGEVKAWGNVLYGGLEFPNASHALKIVSSYGAYAALKKDGKVVTWGDPGYGGDSSTIKHLLAGRIIDIKSSKYGFLILKDDYTAVCLGRTYYSCSMNKLNYTELRQGREKGFEPPKVVAADGRYGGYAALDGEGRIYALGGEGQVSAFNKLNSEERNANYSDIFGSGSSFFAIPRGKGPPTTWSIGFNSPPTTGFTAAKEKMLHLDIRSVKSNGAYYSREAFLALSEDGVVVTWGYSSYGGDASTVQALIDEVKVKDVFTLRVSLDSAKRPPYFGAFLLLTRNHSLIYLGGGSSYYRPPLDVQGRIVQTRFQPVVAASAKSFFAITMDGNIECIGKKNEPVNSKCPRNLGPVVQVVATLQAAAALFANGSVITWGSFYYARVTSEVANLLKSDVLSLYATNKNFAALRSDGRMVQWGYNQLSNVIEKIEKVFPLWGGDHFAASRTNGDTYFGVNEPSFKAPVARLFRDEKGFIAVDVKSNVYFWGRFYDAGTFTALADVRKKFAELPVIDAQQSPSGKGYGAIFSDGTVGFWGFNFQKYTLNSDFSKAGIKQLVAGGSDVGSRSDHLMAINRLGQFASPRLSWYIYDREVEEVQCTGYSYSVICAAKLLNDTLTLRLHSSSTYYNKYLVKPNETYLATTKVKSLAHTRNAFAALMADGTLHTWGRTTSEAKMPDDVKSRIEWLVSKGESIKGVYATEGSFAAHMSDKTLITWGRSTYLKDASEAEQWKGIGTLRSSSRFFFASATSDKKLNVFGYCYHRSFNYKGANPISTVIGVDTALANDDYDVLLFQNGWLAFKADYKTGKNDWMFRPRWGILRAVSSKKAIATITTPFKPVTKSPTTKIPTVTCSPSSTPTTGRPTLVPTSKAPTASPRSKAPTTRGPSQSPTSRSPTSKAPSRSPTSKAPMTQSPSRAPTSTSPSMSPTSSMPTMTPSTVSPSLTPQTMMPTSGSPKTGAPSSSPSLTPQTMMPTSASPHTGAPSNTPSTASPETQAPSKSRSPTSVPSASPLTMTPSMSPSTDAPTRVSLNVVTARLDDSVASVRVVFDRPTTREPKGGAGASACAVFMDAAAVQKLGEDPICVWRQPDQLELVLGRGFTLAAGDRLTLLGGVFSPHALPGYFIPSDFSVKVEPPLNPPLVTAAIVGPSIIGACEAKVELNAIVTGNAGRAVTFSWTLLLEQDGGSGNGSATTVLHQQRSEEATYLIDKNITSSIPVDGFLVVRMNASNWLGSSSNVAEQRIRRSNSTLLPAISLPGPSSLSTVRSSQLLIPTRVSIPSKAQQQCSQASSSSALSVNNKLRLRATWTQVSGPPVKIPRPSLQSLVLPPDTLRTGAQYSFLLKARIIQAARGTSAGSTQDNVLGEASELFNVTVEAEPLRVKIVGGSERIVSVASSSSSSRPGILVESNSASGNADPSYPNASLIVRTWTLVRSDRVRITLTSGRESVLIDPADLDPTFSPYVIMLNVTSNRPDATTARAFTSQRLIVVGAVVPQVTILSSSLQSASVKLANPTGRLDLEARIKQMDTVTMPSANTVDDAYTFKWSCESCGLDLEDKTIVKTSTANRYLSIAPGSLVPASTYTFRVQVWAASSLSSSGEAGSASITFATNVPPSMGACVSEPSSGLNLQTTFRLVCRDWTDADLPLSYKFQLTKRLAISQAISATATHSSNNLNSSTSTFIDLSQFQKVDSITTVLPRAPAPDSNLTLIRSIISDNLGAESYVFVAVNITLPESSSSEEVVASLEQSADSGDYLSFAIGSLGASSFLKSEEGRSNTSQARGLRKKVLSLLDAGDFVELDTMGAVTVVDEMTDVSNTEEFDEDLEQLALSVLSKVPSKLSSSLPGSAARGIASSATTAVENLLSASKALTPAAVSSSSLSSQSSAGMAAVLSNLSSLLVSNAVPGENAQEVGGANLRISSRVLSSASITGSALSTTGGVSVLFPDLEGNGITSDVMLGIISLKGSSLFPRPNSTSKTGGLTIIEVKDAESRKKIPITNTSRPFIFEIPVGQNGTSPSLASTATSRPLIDEPEEVPECLFWDPPKKIWLNDGLKLSNTSSASVVVCESSHLTAFSSGMRFRLRVNTIGEEDATTHKSLDPTQNAMSALVLCLLSVMLILYPIAWYYDNKVSSEGIETLGNTQTVNNSHGWVSGSSSSSSNIGSSLDLRGENARENNELDFWRKLNQVRILRGEGQRSCSNLRVAWKWTLRRKHPWISVLRRHNGDYMNSRKRLLVLVALILNAAVVCSLLAGTNQELLWLRGPVASGLFACILAFPVPFALAYIFARPVPGRFQIAFKQSNLAVLLPCLLVLAEDVELNLAEDGGEDGHDNADDDDQRRENEDGSDDDDDDKQRQVRIGRNLTTNFGNLFGNQAGLVAGAELKENGKNDNSRMRLERKISLHMIRTPSSRVVDSPPRARTSILQIVRRKANRYDDWTPTDTMATIVTIIVILGCSFLLISLSWRAQNTNFNAVAAVLLSFPQDVVIRIFILCSIEAILIAPCLCCCCFLCPYSNDVTEVRSSALKEMTLSCDMETCMVNCEGLVASVTDAGRKMGIQIGWKMTHINGLRVKDGYELEEELRKAHVTSADVVVTFDTTKRGETKDEYKKDKKNSSSLTSDSRIGPSRSGTRLAPLRSRSGLILSPNRSSLLSSNFQNDLPAIELKSLKSLGSPMLGMADSANSVISASDSLNTPKSIRNQAHGNGSRKHEEYLSESSISSIDLNCEEIQPTLKKMSLPRKLQH